MFIRVTGRIALAAGLAVFAAGALSPEGRADSPRWNYQKIDQIEINRNSNAGIGNGGEVRGDLNPPHGPWHEATNGEDGLWDHDPGRSWGRNRAAKNDDRPRSRRGGGTGILTDPVN